MRHYRNICAPLSRLQGEQNIARVQLKRDLTWTAPTATPNSLSLFLSIPLSGHLHYTALHNFCLLDIKIYKTPIFKPA